MAALSSAGQVRRRPAPVNTSMRRARSGICISSDIDIGRSSKSAPNIIPFTPGAGRCSPDDAYFGPALQLFNKGVQDHGSPPVRRRICRPQAQRAENAKTLRQAPSAKPEKRQNDKKKLQL